MIPTSEQWQCLL